jgi:hypothetical protein
MDVTPSEIQKYVSESVTYRSENVPMYLCPVMAFVLEKIIPQLLKGINEQIKYFVYGGRATVAYKKRANEPYSPSSDWDLLFDDRQDPDVVPRFAKFARETMEKVINERFRYITPISVLVSDKAYSQAAQTGRYEIQIVDPFMPYVKTYDVLGISGCHDTHLQNEQYGNYCSPDVFRSIELIEDIYYAGPMFLQLETHKVFYTDRQRKLVNDMEELKEAITAKKRIEQQIDEYEPPDDVAPEDANKILLELDDVGAMERIEDAIDLYLRSYTKTVRTEQRL